MEGQKIGHLECEIKKEGEKGKKGGKEKRE